MKSKRAKEYMNRVQMYGSARKQTEKAVERAEDDARDRAVKAYCKAVYGIFCDDCTGCDMTPDTCERRNEFLKRYEEEQ